MQWCSIVVVSALQAQCRSLRWTPTLITSGPWGFAEVLSKLCDFVVEGTGKMGLEGWDYEVVEARQHNSRVGDCWSERSDVKTGRARSL